MAKSPETYEKVASTFKKKATERGQNQKVAKAIIIMALPALFMTQPIKH